jgi:hypothetical protein
MKKILIIGSLLIAIILIAGFFILIKSGPKQTIVTGQKEAEWATRELLRKRAENSLDTLVMGTSIEPGKWDFRGVSREGESGLLVYGVIKLTCGKPAKNIKCWKLETLNRNGRDWRININTQDKSGLKPEKNTSKAEKPVTQKIPQNNAPEIEKWAVKGLSVNGRSGPGTGFNITAKINPKIDLQLIESKNGWGKFNIVTPSENTPKTVWIWMDLVSKK